MQMNGKARLSYSLPRKKKILSKENSVIKRLILYSSRNGERQFFTFIKKKWYWVSHGGHFGFVDTSVYQLFRGLQESINIYQTALCHISEDVYNNYIF